MPSHSSPPPSSSPTSNSPSAAKAAAINPLRALNEEFQRLEHLIALGGGEKAVARQHEKGRLTARERISALIDPGSSFQELALWAAWGMYEPFGGAPGASVVTGFGRVSNRLCMVIANDATVKAGAFFPMTCKKIIRAQVIAEMARLPLIYLVDSAGVFLPLQEDVFPDTDDFGRIFRNNARLSAQGIPQIAAIMGYCVAGGGYLPVLCDTILMTEGSGLYLAAPALVKAAIGQVVTDEELGGAKMHAQISGNIDFREKDDPACLSRLRSLFSKLDSVPLAPSPSAAATPVRSPDNLYSIYTDKTGAQYDTKEIIACLVDARTGSADPDFDEYKPEFGQSLVCGYARIGARSCGIVANQKKLTQRSLQGASGGGQKSGPLKTVGMPGVIYDESADKAARFIMDCNQRRIPILFLHDTTGFMVGRESEQSGIIRAGAKMVNVMANSIVPKIVLILGGSYGAGNYAMCGRAFDPFLSLAWPCAKYAVMGANQATSVLAQIEEASRKRKGEAIDDDTHKAILEAVHTSYTEQADIRHAAARGWIDRIIEPHNTRDELIAALDAAGNWDYSKPFQTGVLQT